MSYIIVNSVNCTVTLVSRLLPTVTILLLNYGACSRSRSLAPDEAMLAARGEAETQAANKAARESLRQHAAAAAAEEAASAVDASRVAAEAIASRLVAEIMHNLKRLAVPEGSANLAGQPPSAARRALFPPLESMSTQRTDGPMENNGDSEV